MDDLLNKRGSRYSDRPETVLVTDVYVLHCPLTLLLLTQGICSHSNPSLGFQDSLPFMHYGDQWRRHRRWFQSSFQAVSALASYHDLQNRECMRLVSDFIKIAGESGTKTGLETGSAAFSALKRCAALLETLAT